MAATLTTLRDRVETILADSGNAIWATSDIDEAIRQALDEYSLARPYINNTTDTFTSATRQIDVSAVTGLQQVFEVTIPYTSTAADLHRRARPFHHWVDEQKITVRGAYTPATGDVAQIRYSKVQELNGLLVAGVTSTSTTFPDGHESVIATGAAGFAATSRAIDLAEEVTIDRETGKTIQEWGREKMADFLRQLNQVATKEYRGRQRIDADDAEEQK